ncbi:hypothetical protein JCM19237_5213 [Photobacterium aphoticum]|uniref:Uncharacterized protein n=1 Tax=Photobacterium aphoticum TaxID=754436 RepID=A0A090QGQ1_9GAMM|nr:hypothetical protein JCM19237_5213 [Photobacterium aphoticum]
MADWLRLLRAVKTERIDRDAARRVAILNKDLDSVIREAQ